VHWAFLSPKSNLKTKYSAWFVVLLVSSRELCCVVLPITSISCWATITGEETNYKTNSEVRTVER
jgi:hypothetical protein